jgi:hypothetical protein
LTSASLQKAHELHDFYLREGIKNVCFNVEEIEVAVRLNPPAVPGHRSTALPETSVSL